MLKNSSLRGKLTTASLCGDEDDDVDDDDDDDDDGKDVKKPRLWRTN